MRTLFLLTLLVAGCCSCPEPKNPTRVDDPPPAEAVAGVAVTTRRPILTVRAKTAINSIRNRGHIFPRDVYVMAATNNAYVELVLNGSISGGADVWTNLSATQSCVEYNTDHNAISGGRVLRAFYATSGSGTSRNQSTQSDFMDLPLIYSDLLSVQSQLSVVATAQTGTSTVNAALSGHEYY